MFSKCLCRTTNRIQVALAQQCFWMIPLVTWQTSTVNKLTPGKDAKISAQTCRRRKSTTSYYGIINKSNQLYSPYVTCFLADVARAFDSVKKSLWHHQPALITSRIPLILAPWKEEEIFGSLSGMIFHYYFIFIIYSSFNLN